MSSNSRTALAQAFREAVLGVIGVFEVYEVDRDVAEATADVLGRLFRRHLCRTATIRKDERFSSMHELVDEMDLVLDG